MNAKSTEGDTTAGGPASEPSGKARGTQYRADHNKETGIHKFVRSIDATRMQAANAIQGSDDRLNLLIENGLDNISLVSAEGKLMWESPAVVRTLDYPPDAFIGADLFQLVHPDDLATLKDELAGILQLPGSRKRATFRLRHHNGSWRWVDAAATNLLDKPNVASIVINYRDITELKLSEEKLRESEAHYRSLFENMLDGFAYCKMIFDHDRPQDFIYLGVNAAFEELTGLKDVVGSKVSEVIPGIQETNPELFETYGRVALTGKPERFETYVGPLGIWFSISVYCPAREYFVAVFDNITERKQAEDKLNKQLQFVEALREIDQVVASTYGLHMSLDTLLTHVTAQLEVDAADVLLLTPEMQTLDYVAGRGFRSSAFREASLRLGEGHAGQVALKGENIYISNLQQQNDNTGRAKDLAEEGFIGYYAVPLITKANVGGVLEIFRRDELRPNPEWLDRLNVLAGQAAIALENALLFENLERSNLELSMAYDATIAGWSHAMDLRDRETEGHIERVTEATIKLAARFGLPEERITHIRRGALLHDIGKMGVPDAILLKPDKLTEEE